MNTDELKKLGGPKLAKAKEDQNDKIDTVITLLGALCDSGEASLSVSNDILEGQTENHSVWVKVSKHRRYINLAAVMVTGAILWLDVLKLNPNSEIVGSVVNIAKALAGMLL